MPVAPLEHLVPLPVPSEALPERAAVAIIGGGIMGDQHRVPPGAGGRARRRARGAGHGRLGSSAKPLGGIRATFSDPGNIQLGQRSLEAFERFDAEFGTDIEAATGGLPVPVSDTRTRPTRWPRARRSRTASAATRGSSRPARPRPFQPYLDPQALVGASLLAQGRLRATGAGGRGIPQAAARLGAGVCERTEVLGIGRAAGVHELHTTRGALVADTIVIAAGAWSRRVGAMVGIDLPVEPLRRLIGVTAPLRPAPGDIPFTLDLSSTLYFHGAGDEALLVGISHPGQAAGFGRDFDHEWVPAFDEAAAVVAPSLVGLSLVGGWAGLYEDTPDHNACIGRAEQVEGVLYATGFSGHGFLQGPAVGELVRDLYLGRTPFLDPTPFGAARFGERDARIRELHII
ncbi:MAG: FAD-binding oxidoreductase [Chloroflexota bacterium]